MRIKSLIVSLVFIIATAFNGVSSVAAQEIPTGKYLGDYYNGKNFDTLVMSRYDDKIEFNWFIRSPDSKIGRDNFSIRWQGKFNFDNSLYEFTVVSDDGARMYLDGEKIIDAWTVQQYRSYKVRKEVSAGTHTIVVEYFESGMYAAVRAFWEKVTPSVTAVTPQPGTNYPTGVPSNLAGLYDSSCVELIATPIEGSTPLTVEFTGAGYDPYGLIAKYRFNFGDGGEDSIKETEDYFATYVYKKGGGFNPTLQVQDSKGVWKTSDDCKITLAVKGNTGIGGGGDLDPAPMATVSSLPETGLYDNPLLAFVSLLGTGLLGIYLMRRFRTV